MRIRRLDPNVVDRIAAGEVVERPASALKELLENALDAGSRIVTAEVAGAGLERIRVADDGEGMTRDEVVLSVERHATSKIRTETDLSGIRTFGFRGEALAAIASVAEIEIRTRRRGEDVGTLLRGRDGRFSIEAWGGAEGTVVDVLELFGRTPARRKFLKSDATENHQLVSAFLRCSLARPDVRTEFRGSGGETTVLPAADAATRSCDVLGGENARRLAASERQEGSVRVRVLVSPPGVGTPNRMNQYFVVNGRCVAHRGLSYALADLTREGLPPGRHATAVIRVDVGPGELDVNVHPAKTEVRFSDERAVVAVVRRALAAALRSPAAIPEFTLPGARPAIEISSLPPGAPPFLVAAGESEPAFGVATDAARAAANGMSAPSLPPLTFVAQTQALFLLAEGADGLYVVDQHAAHERVVYEALVTARADRSTASQRVLLPASIELSAAEWSSLREHRAALEGAGFEWDARSGRTVSLTSVPAPLASADARAAFSEGLAALAEGSPGALPAEERVRQRLACHSATVAGERMTRASSDALLAALARCREPFTCPHGRPSVMRLTTRDLLRYFRRT